MEDRVHAWPPEGTFAPFDLVGELGARPLPAFVVRQAAAPDTKPHLFVAERFVGVARGADGKDSEFFREARRIATLANPNLPRVREVAARGADVVVTTDLVDGEKLMALWQPGALPLEIALRVLVDVLSAAGALHTLRDAKQQPMKVSHGELSPATIVLGTDGIARVLHAVARRLPGARPDPASVRTMAPEVLAGEAWDHRADIYGAGVLLWEALTGAPLYEENIPAAIVARARGGPPRRASVPAKAPWAKDLVNVAAKALAPAPADRWQLASVMVAELRKVAGLKLAPVSASAAYAKGAVADKARARRARLEAASVVASVASVAPSAPPPAPTSDAPISVDLISIPPGPAADPADADVLVAPGLRAPVADVVELGVDALLEASSSIPPPGPPPRIPTLSPPTSPLGFAPLTGPPPPPLPSHRPGPSLAPPTPALGFAPLSSPPAPAHSLAPAHTLPPAPPLTAPAVGAPPAFDDPAALPPARGATETAPSLQRQVEWEQASRRRKTLVLGGVAAFGALVLLLAAGRWMMRDDSPSPPAIAAAPRAPPPAVAPSPVAAASEPPSLAAVAASPTPALPASGPAAPASVPAPSTAQITGAARPPSEAAAKHHPKPSSPHPSARPKRPKPTFEPNSL